MLTRQRRLEYLARIRRAAPLLALWSALLLLACLIAAWVDGYRFARSAALTFGGQSLALGSHDGEIYVALNTNAHPTSGWSYLQYPTSAGEHPLLRAQHLAGFGRYIGNRPSDFSTKAVTYRVVYIPAWFAVLIAAAASGWLFHKWYRSRPHPPGVCRVCGYDLRATPDRCPECGTAAGAVPSG